MPFAGFKLGFLQNSFIMDSEEKKGVGFLKKIHNAFTNLNKLDFQLQAQVDTFDKLVTNFPDTLFASQEAIEEFNNFNVEFIGQHYDFLE